MVAFLASRGRTANGHALMIFGHHAVVDVMFVTSFRMTSYRASMTLFRLHDVYSVMI